jgi:uncharacterized protein (TIGR03437 family)
LLAASPISGTTPATITVSPGTNVLGTYTTNLGFATTPLSPPPYAGLAKLAVNLTYTLPPPPVIHSIVNAASFQPGPLSPGEIVSIFGDNLCPLADATSASVDPFTPPIIIFFSNSGNTTVSFVGGASGGNAPILYCAGGQVNAVVPKQVAGQSSVNVTLAHYFVAAPTLSLPVTATTPAIFSANGQGYGQGAILNANSTVNSASNPAAKGSTVQIFGEGGGVLTPDELANGQVDNVLGPPPVTVAPVSVTIGGLPAQIAYAGQAPDQVAGVIQVNAVIPQNIGSGAQTVVLTVGANSNASQQITVAVQ